MKYIDVLRIDPGTTIQKNDVFRIVETTVNGETKHNGWYADPNDVFSGVKHHSGPSSSDAAGNHTSGNWYEWCIKFDGKKFRRL